MVGELRLFNAVNVRNGWDSVLSKHTLAKPALWIALVSVAVLQVVNRPGVAGRRLLGAEPLPLVGWLVAFGCAAIIVVLSEAARAVRRMRSGEGDCLGDAAAFAAANTPFSRRPHGRRPLWVRLRGTTISSQRG